MEICRISKEKIPDKIVGSNENYLENINIEEKERTEEIKEIEEEGKNTESIPLNIVKKEKVNVFCKINFPFFAKYFSPSLQGKL